MFLQKLSICVCSSLILLSFSSHAQSLPPAPSLTDQVHAVEQSQTHLHPVIPTFRTSEDGRVAMSNKKHRGMFVFQLNVPEKISQQFLDSPNGTGIVNSPGFELDPAVLKIPSNQVHSTICDPSRQFQVNSYQGYSIKNNPFVCGQNNDFDCYDLKLITSVKRGSPNSIELWETPIRVTVRNPKTVNARIRNIKAIGNSVRTATFQGATTMFEPLIAGEDKRLLIARVGNSPLSWDDNGKTRTGNYNIVYSAASESFAPCDSRGFDHLTPISHAPYDNDIKTKYGFAANLFRDPMGHVVPNGVEIGGTYPWVDKKAANMVMMGVNVNLYNYNSTSRSYDTRYPTRCVSSGCNLNPANSSELDAIESTGDPKGFIVTGLWTNGKMVYMDNPIHNVDFGLRTPDMAQREILLYSNGPNSGFVRVGSGRDNRNGNLQNLRGNSFNTSFFESVENLWNHLPNMRPRTPRDVVWYVGNGVRTHEFAFDDYMDQGVLINSPMNAAFERRPVGTNDAYFHHHDGYDIANARWGLEVKLQNAATSQRWNIPTHGRINGNNASSGRVEPIAMGGAHAKGFYTRNNQGIVYDIPAQSVNPIGKSWYVSFFIDPRFNDDGKLRSLLRFPEGDQIALVGRSRLRFRNKGGDISFIDLNSAIPRNKWSHLGFQITPRGRFIRTYLNGFHLGTYKNPNRSDDSFLIKQGTLSFAFNFIGWVDEFKVIEGQFSFEEYCNYASGTLVGLTDSYSGPLTSVASQYPAWTHRKIENHLKSISDPRVADRQKYACRVNYESINHIDVNDRPAGTFSLRQTILFPEGPLVFNEPRPDSTNNQFCLRCHKVDGKRGLDLDALSFDVRQWQVQDQRRQPMQALRLMFGNIPAGYLHNRNHNQTTNSGIQVDRSQNPDN